MMCFYRGRSHLRGLTTLIFLFCLTSVPPVYSASSDVEQVRIISTNDIHNYLRPIYYRYIDEIKPWGPQSREGDYAGKAELIGKIGGMAHVATVINRLRDEKPGKTLLVDAGDTWHGTGLSYFDNGETMVKVMNAIGYDFMTPGNWDFFHPEEQFMNLVDQANFPVVAYNLTDKEWEDPVLSPYAIKQVGALKIAIVGMTYPWTALTSSVRGAANAWKFGIKENEARDLIQDIRRKENPDLVVFVSHGGYGLDQKFAQRVDGIDVLVSGHTHDEVFDPVIWNDTILFQAGAHGKYVARLDLEIKDKDVVSADYKLILVNQNEIPADKKIAELINAAYLPYQKKLDEVIGETRSMLYRRDYWQSTLGNLITGALRETANTDIAFFPAWRYGATLLPGEITVEDVYNIVPTGAEIVTYSMRGKEIKMLLENIMDSVADTDAYARVGGDMIRFSGMKLRYDLRNKTGKRIVSMMVGDKAMEAEKYYSVASASTQFHNNPMFGASQVKNTGIIFTEELINFIRKNSPISVSLDDRIMAEKHH